MTTINNVLDSLKLVLANHPGGLSVPELQIQIYRESGYKLSYQEIESTFFRYPFLFREEDGRWRPRGD